MASDDQVKEVAKEAATTTTARRTGPETALDELRESEQRYRLLADAMPQIIWTADADGSFDYYNRRWYEYTGRTPDETLGWGWQPILHPEDVERCLRLWAISVMT